MSKINSLRAVTHRLNNTPVKELPHIASFLASSILNCADALKNTSGQSAGKNDDLALQTHKLKARISSLLQDRSAEGRFTAVILVKATVEAGGREILESCEPWLRGLLAILGKPDPIPSKRLCLLTITRIFSLTQQYPTLIREITTPLLPSFITACMKLGDLHPSTSDHPPQSRLSPYLETVLQCMLHLIPDHPSTFRPFASKLHTSLTRFIGGQSTPDYITRLSQSVFVTLHFCAPKNTAGNVWLNACEAVVTSAHGIADQILRAVIEDWDTSSSGRRQVPSRKAFDEVPHSIESDPLQLPPWEGIYQASKVLSSLLQLLEKFSNTQTLQSVHLPIGLILDLTSRLLYVRVPETIKESQTSIRFNPEIGREERDELLTILPDIHQSTLHLLSSLVEANGLNVLPVSSSIIDQCLWVFGTENSNESIRLATYELLDHLLLLMGPSTTKDSFQRLVELIEFCCKDVLSRESKSELLNQSKVGLNSKIAMNGHADSFLQTSSKKTTKLQPQISALETTASRLMCHVLEYIPAQAIPHSLRAQIDRTAILKDQQRIMLASVLNPPPQTTGKYPPPSVMPFLARAAQGVLEVEGLLRPRMPVVRQAKISAYELEMESEEDIEQQQSKGSESANVQNISTLPRTESGTPGAQNDILDRLEDSIDDHSLAPSNVEPPQPITANEAIAEPLAERNDAAPHRSPLPQGAKRNLDTADAYEEEEESSKRFRRAQSDSKPDAVALAQEMTEVASASIPAMLGPDPVVPTESAIGATLLEKGKGKAMDVSPRPDSLAARFGSGSGDEDDDDSGSDMPPLYLKTTDSEEEEYGSDDDDEIL
jgi:pre-rRNA-processing protein RIX1